MSARENLNKHQFPASQAQPGDYLDIMGKVRVHAVLSRNGKTTLAYKVKGSKSPGIDQHPDDKVINVWRRA